MDEHAKNITVYGGNLSSRYSTNSEAFAPEVLEISKKCFLVTGSNYGVENTLSSVSCHYDAVKDIWKWHQSVSSSGF